LLCFKKKKNGCKDVDQALLAPSLYKLGVEHRRSDWLTEAFLDSCVESIIDHFIISLKDPNASYLCYVAYCSSHVVAPGVHGPHSTGRSAQLKVMGPNTGGEISGSIYL
jgi:hypothetical protein